MLRDRTLSLNTLIHLCQVMRHYLGSGLTLLDVFRAQAKTGPSSLRSVSERLVGSLERGDTLGQALGREKAVFPVLFRALSKVGEASGMLPEVYSDLEKYYTRQRQLRRDFLAQIAWPVVQLVFCIFILAGLILFLGVIADRNGPDGEPYDPLGFGLIGASGAAKFLGLVFGFFALLWVGYLVLTRVFQQRTAISIFLLGLPAIGPCLRALATSRFCTALQLTYETGMAIGRALAMSLRATGNPAFETQSESVKNSVRAGTEIAVTLERTHLFPKDFEHIISTAEMSGRLSEVLRQQAAHYNEEAGRRLKILGRTAGIGVWALVGLVVIFCIFRLYFSYFESLSKIG